MNRNAKLGLVLFLIYLILYVGFVMLNTFAPQAMERTPVAGVNLAVLYGFGLIAAAFLLAMLYGVLCGRRVPEPGPLPSDSLPSHRTEEQRS